MISTKTITKTVCKRLLDNGYDCEVTLIPPACTSIGIYNVNFGSIVFSLEGYKTVREAVEAIVNSVILHAKQQEEKQPIDLSLLTAHLKDGSKGAYAGHDIEYRIMNKVINVSNKNKAKLLGFAKRNMAKQIYLQECSNLPFMDSVTIVPGACCLYMETVYDFSGLLLFDDIFALLAKQECSDIIIVPMFAGLLLLPAKRINSTELKEIYKQLQLAQYMANCTTVPESFKHLYRFDSITNTLSFV